MDTEIIKRGIAETHRGDPRFFIENMFYIATKGLQIAPFKFNRLQNYMHENRTGRDYWLKFRQGGSSLYHIGMAAATAMCVPNYTAAVITLSSDNGKTKERLFRHVTRFIENMPPEFKLGIETDRKDAVAFENGSQLYIGGVGSKDFARGETIHRLMVTELGSFTDTDAHNVLTSSVESVVPEGEIVFETTPKTAGSYAHVFFEQCKAGEKPYTANFIPWWWAGDYSYERGSFECLPRDRGALEFSEEERVLIEKFPVDAIPHENRIRWRRTKLADRDEDFFSEYPEDDTSCWAARTNSVFPVDRIRMMTTLQRDPMEVVDGVLRIYKEASSLHRYVIGIDAAGGIIGGDYSGAVVQSVETGEVMAVFQGLVGGDTLARQIAELSLRYGRAMAGGERDAWTMPLMDKLEGLGIPLYYHEDDGKLGFPNTNTSRLQGVGTLKAAISEGDFITYDRGLIQEIANYERQTNTDSNVERYSAPKGQHDDICVAAQRAQQMRTTVPRKMSFNARVPDNDLVSMYAMPQTGW